MNRRIYIIYIETTIPSFCFEVRPEPEMVARRNWTRDWWAVASIREEIVTSKAVLEELGAGEHPRRADCLAMVAELPLLAIDSAVAETVEGQGDLGAFRPSSRNAN